MVLSRMPTLILVFVLPGCSYIAQHSYQKMFDEEMRQFEMKAEKCVEGPLTRSNVMERRACVDNALIHHLSAANYRYMPLVEQSIAEQKLAAAQFKAGKITKDEYEALSQLSISRWQQQEQAAVNRAQQANKESTLQALQAMQNSMPSYTSTNCYSFSPNSINCTTH